MASIRKIKGTDKWIAEVRLKKGGYKSKIHYSKIEAAGWAVDLERQMGKRGKQVTGKTLGEAFERYAAEVSPTRKGGKREIIRLKVLGRQPFANITLDDLQMDDLRNWMNTRMKEVSGSSVNRELNIISVVLKHCRAQWKWMRDNPLQDITRPAESPPRDRRITQDEIKRILLALEYDEAKPVATPRQQIAVAFLLALETAMRHGELWSLTWANVDLKKHFAVLPATKNGSKREVALSKRAIELLKKLKGLSPERVLTVPAPSAEAMFRRARELAGIEGLTFHDTRHEAITRLARKLDVLDLARMVGHRDPRSLMIYYNAKASEIAKRLD